jgi:hypothetical protein
VSDNLVHLVNCHRDQIPDKVTEELREATTRSSFEELSEQFSSETFVISEQADILAKDLEADFEDLPEKTVAKIATFVNRVRKLIGETIPVYLDKLLTRLERVYELEKKPNPRHQAEAKVMSLLPTFALFTNDMRLLDDSYVITDVVQKNPPALLNLLTLAGSSVQQIASTSIMGI